MIIDEFTGDILDPESIDYTLGSVHSRDIAVRYRYILEQPAEYEEVVVAEYPNGGKDVAMKEISPEIGHWEIVNQVTGDILNYPIELDTNGLPKDKEIPDTIHITTYRPYTPEELEEIAEQNRIFEEQQREAREKQEIMDALPDRMSTVETTQDDIVLLMADILGGAL